MKNHQVRFVALLLVGLLVLGIILWPLERMFPSVRGKKMFRKGFRVDVIYWFFTPTVNSATSITQPRICPERCIGRTRAGPNDGSILPLWEWTRILHPFNDGPCRLITHGSPGSTMQPAGPSSP